jgi:hypothetical protein
MLQEKKKRSFVRDTCFPQQKRKQKKRIIIFTKFLVFFSQVFYYCMELLYMTTVEKTKEAPFLDTFLLDIFLT